MQVGALLCASELRCGLVTECTKPAKLCDHTGMAGTCCTVNRFYLYTVTPHDILQLCLQDRSSHCETQHC